MIVAIFAYRFVVDFPENNKFLTADETKFIIQRLDKDRGDVEIDRWTWNKLLSYLLTPKLWAFGVLFGSASICAYAFAYFLPLILVGMGFSAINAQLLAAPPYVATFFVAFGLAYLGDKYIIRAPIIMFQAVLTILGLSIVSISYNILMTTNASSRPLSIPMLPSVILEYS
jgi:cyanate permease